VAVFSRFVALTRSVSFSVLVLGLTGQAMATPFGPEEATELLARTLSADVKCKVLNTAENDQLQSFVAQAEIALAEQSGVQKTKATLDRGKAAGAKVACDATTAKAVRGVLVTARDALASSSDLRKEQVAQNDDQEDDTIAAEPIQKKTVEKTTVATAVPEKSKPETDDGLVTVKTPAKPIKTAAKKPETPKVTDTKVASTKLAVTKSGDKKLLAKVTEKKAPVKKIEADVTVETASVKKPQADKTAAKKPKSGPALVAYSKLAEAYFVELKCRKMSKGDVQAFYGKVMQNHRTAIAAHGGSLVSSTLRGAQARANGKSCG
jgi:hypothetical protein